MTPIIIYACLKAVKPSSILGATGLVSEAVQRIIGGDGVITCDYTVSPPIFNVVWEYKGPTSTVYEKVYDYVPGGAWEALLHLKNRSTHTHSSNQVKLIIHEVNETDDGIYRGQVIGSQTPYCYVDYSTISKVLQ